MSLLRIVVASGGAALVLAAGGAALSCGQVSNEPNADAQAGDSGPSSDTGSADGGAPACGPPQLDPTFGGGGLVTLPSFTATAVARDAQGRVVVVGNDAAGFAVVRLLPDGSLDPAFGTNGHAESVGVDGGTSPDAGAAGAALLKLQAVALQPDGKIVAAGSSPGSEQEAGALVVVRFEANGALDHGFGDNGSVTTRFPRAGSQQPPTVGAGAVAVLPDGRIVAAGGWQWLDWGPSFEPVVRGAALARYGADGTLDVSFGTRSRDLENPTDPHGVALLPGGKLLLAGSNAFTDRHSRTTYSVSLVSVDTEGAGENLAPPMDIPGTLAGGIVADSQGRFVVAGNFAEGKAGFVRTTSTGSIDRLVGAPLNGVLAVVAAFVQPDDRVVVVGQAGVTSAEDSSKMRLVRFAADDGTTDSTFGPDGAVDITMPVSPPAFLPIAGVGHGCEMIVIGDLTPDAPYPAPGKTGVARLRP